MIFIFLFVIFANAHNWIHGLSRARKASQLVPAPPRAGPRQPHRQVGLGQDFVIEWSTGHSHFYYFTIVSAKDESKMKEHSEALLNTYIVDAPDSAYIYEDPKYHRIHTSCNHGYESDPRGGGCGITEYNSGSRYDRIIEEDDPRWMDRTQWDTSITRPVTLFKYRDSDLRNDRRVAYHNEKYPWIVSVHKFQVQFGFGQEWDSARFSFPSWVESGEYVVHMLWRGYYDAVDVDYLPSAANDIYGSPAPNPSWVKTDHCAYPNIFTHLNSDCWFYQPGESIHNVLSYCVRRGEQCKAVNCIPIYTPREVKIQGRQPRNALVPWEENETGASSNKCSMSDIPENADDKTFVCYTFKNRPPTDPTFNPDTENDWYDVDNDYEDPIFYSTCFRLERRRVFDNNPDCPLCESQPAEVTSRWQVGDRCVSCDSLKEAEQLMRPSGYRDDGTPRYKLHFWELANTCEKCF